MERLYSAFASGGFSMFPIEVVGIILVVASIRYAIDTEPIRLRFIKSLSLVLIAMMFVAAVWGTVVLFEGMALQSQAERGLGMAQGISIIINTWGLGFVDLVIALIIITVGVYRAGRKELKALKP